MARILAGFLACVVFANGESECNAADGANSCASVSGHALMQRKSAIDKKQATVDKSHTADRTHIIMGGDTIYLRAHTGKHLDADNGEMNCRFDDHGDRQMFRIEKRLGGGIHQLDTIYLRTHEDKYVGVQKESVKSDWPVPEQLAPSLLQSTNVWPGQDDYDFSGFDPLDDHGFGSLDFAGSYEDYEFDDNPWEWAMNGDYDDNNDGIAEMPGGIQLAFQIEKETPGTDVIRVNDTIYLRTYTTRFLNVDGTNVQASGFEEFEKHQAFTIERDPPPLSKTRTATVAREYLHAVKSMDTIYLRAHNGKHLQMSPWAIDHRLQAMFDKQSDLAGLRFVKDYGGMVKTGDTVYIKAHDGYHVMVNGDVITESSGSWRDEMQFTIENEALEKRELREGDEIYLKAHTGNYVEVYQPWCPFESPYVHVTNADRNKDQKFIVEFRES